MKEYINNNNWHDYFLESINVDYEKATIKLSFGNKLSNIECINFIGMQYLGQWDESVVADINIIEEDEFCLTNRLAVRKNNPTEYVGGGVKSIGDVWYHVVVKLIDNVSIHIVCTKINVKDSKLQA